MLQQRAFCSSRRSLAMLGRLATAGQGKRRVLATELLSINPQRASYSTGTSPNTQPIQPHLEPELKSKEDQPKGDSGNSSSKKERPPGTTAIYIMEAIGATTAFIYFLHLYTDILKPEVKERLAPEKYMPFTLIEKEQLTADTSRFRFRVNRPRFDSDQEKLVDEIIASGSWALDVKDHMVQTYRTYTPVHYWVSDKVDEKTGAREGYVDIVVKRYPHGSLSRFLHDTRVGDQVEMRGPLLTWPYKPNQYKHVYMIAGGTGIAPMYQLVDRVLNDPNDTSTKLSLLYGSQSEQDIIYKHQLDKLASEHPDRFEIVYLVDRPPFSGTATKVGNPSKQNIEKFTSRFDETNDIVLVCGPDAMLASVCGSRPINAGQGPLGGVLKELGFSTNVFKF